MSLMLEPCVYCAGAVIVLFANAVLWFLDRWKGQQRRMDSNDRKCKRCLIREMAGHEKIYEIIRRMIDDLPHEERASDSRREDRLAVCKQCERLTDGMCAACGCYVELRATIADQTCPYDIWK